MNEAKILGAQELRVLQVVNMASVTTRGFVLPLARRLVAQGCDVTVAAGPGKYFGDYRDAGCAVEEIPIRRKLFAAANIAVVRKLSALMRRERFHIVHTHTLFTSALARIAAALARVPAVIYEPHGSYFGRGPLAKYFFVGVERMLQGVNSFVIVLNEDDARDFVSYGLATSDNIRSLGCGGTGVDLSIFDPDRIAPKTTRHLRRTLGIPNHHSVCTFVGRMVQAKGIDDLVEAFRRVTDWHSDVTLVMVGDVLESERDQKAFVDFKQKSERYGLGDRIVLAGFREDIPEIMALTDVLVHPSHIEGFGLPLAEAAAMRTPVVVTNTRGGREAVIDGKTGLIIPIGDPAALAGALAKLLANPERRENMARLARRRAEKKFDRERILDIKMQIYRDLVARTSSHPFFKAKSSPS